MGAAREDVHKHEYQYKQINFSDVDCIKGLIKNRWMIDTYRGIELNNDINSAGDVQPINQELICLFADLDDLIEKAKLNKKQLHIVNMLMDGNNEEDVADFYKQSTSVIYRAIDTICERIKKANDYEWKYNNIYLNYLKVKWEYKRCSRCLEDKPKTKEFFSPDIRNKDGLHSLCRSCR